MKEKLLIRIKKVIAYKRFIYISSIIFFALFSIALNIAFSSFTNRQENVIANVKVKNMAYNISVNGITGTKLKALGNKTTTANIVINAWNQMDSKYELIYKVCSDELCTTYINKPSELAVEYSSRTVDSITGAITSNGTKQLRIVVTNNSVTNYYIELGINAGYIYNTLELQDLITMEYNEDDIKIAAIIDGQVSTSFPTVKIYDSSVSCTTNEGISNAIGTSTWNGSKWVINISGVDNGQTKCNAIFTVRQPEITITCDSKNCSGIVSNVIENPTVTIYANGTPIAYTNTDTNGSWNISTSSLSPGSYVMYATVYSGFHGSTARSNNTYITISTPVVP